jgi:hypothetical protein
MRRPVPWIRRAATACALAAFAIAPLAGQDAGPRTPWGDPDLQGTYTNTYENGTPLERPDVFAGRPLAGVTGEELRAIRRQIQEQTIARFLGPEHAPDNWWQDNLFLERGSQAWLIVDPADGKIPPLTSDAQRRLQQAAAARKASGRGPADSYTDRSLYDRCITRGYPGSMMPAIYGNQYEIVQAPGMVAIRYEMIHETRLIPLDSPPSAGPGPIASAATRAHMGSARGRFEGGTLVVETTNFRPESVFRNADPDRLRVIERFTRISPEQVRWTVTIDDPATWTRPWTFSLPLTRDPHPVPHYECHEGNYGLPNILSAARAEEAAREREGPAAGRTR